MKVAFISDSHEDFWISAKLSGHKLLTTIENFVDEVLKPKEADILVIAGDTSHYNNQTEMMLRYLASKKMYKKIFVTFGNHNLYLVSNSQESKYKKSWNKVLELKQMCEAIETVEFLDGNIVEVDGVRIGGCSMWYDFSYGKKIGNLDDFQMLQKWKSVMNDANLIKGDDYLGSTNSGGMYSYGKTKHYTFDPLKFFEQEKEKFLKIIEDCDVFVSHFGPVVPPDIQPHYKNTTTGFYYFDGERYLWADKAPKLYIFGHTHDTFQFQVNNTILACNPLGYKSENTGVEIEVISID